MRGLELKCILGIIQYNPGQGGYVIYTEIVS